MAVKTKPNAAKLNALYDELQALKNAGRLDEPTYQRILNEALNADGGDGNLSSFVYQFAQPGWNSGLTIKM